MKEEILRIMKLVQDGKLSAEDAAELIDAFEEAPEEQTPRDEAQQSSEQEAASSEGKKTEQVKNILETIERIGKDIAKSVDWNEVAGQVRSGAKKGLDTLKQAAEQAKMGKAPFGFFFSEERKEVELPISSAEGKTLRIENSLGEIQVSGGKKANMVRAKAGARGFDAEDARKKADAYTLMIEESDQFISIHQPMVSGLNVDLEIELETQMPLEVKSAAGAIEIRGMKGGCRIQSGDGSIKLHELGGVAEITSAAGQVYLNTCDFSNLTLENKSGDITAIETRGNLNVRTSSGDVNLIHSSGRTISIEAVSGDVTLDLDRPISGNVNVRTVQGDTKIGICDTNDCRVALTTLRGRIDCELDLAEMAKEQQRVTGRLGSGEGTLDVSAVSGDVRLFQREAPCEVS